MLTIRLVTPNLNGGDFLPACIESVLRQDYRLLEYVIVDGQSTDQSASIIESYLDRCHRVVVEADRGHGDALNKGFADSECDIMGWINSDDVLLPGTLETVAAVFAKYPDVEWITGRVSTIDAGGGHLQSRLPRNLTYGHFLAGDFMWIQQESTFWRKSLWDRSGGFVSTAVDLAVDFELWLRFFRTARLHTVDALLGAFRFREGQRSSVFRERYLAECEALIAAEIVAAPHRATLRRRIAARVRAFAVAQSGSSARPKRFARALPMRLFRAVVRRVRRLRRPPYAFGPRISFDSVRMATAQAWLSQLPQTKVAATEDR